MKTLDYVLGADPVFLPALLAGLAIATAGGVLSVFVVTRRLAFVGQGISHAAFAGVGLGVWLGVGAGGASQSAIVGVVCLVTGWLIGWLSEREDVSEDSAIGILLVGAMALGAVLIHLGARRHGALFVPSWEGILFGSILAVGRGQAVLAWIACAAVVACVFLTRRALVLWSYDEQAARSSGLHTGLLRLLLLTLLSVFIVVAMRLAGVVLVTALLVLPGAIALRLTSRLRGVVLWSVGAGVAGMAGGLVLSFELDLPPGACVVLVLAGMFAAASVLRRALDRRGGAAGAGEAPAGGSTRRTIDP